MILVSVGPAPGALALPEVVGELSDAGHRVSIVLQPGTRRFVGPAAFDAVNVAVRAPVRASVGPGEVPEAVLFAPAVADTLARLARGLYEPSYTPGAPAFVAPDLDTGTAAHPAVRENLALLDEAGVRVIRGPQGGQAGNGAGAAIPPATTLGTGMAPAGEIAARVLSGLGGEMSGIRVLVSAGGTREPLDSVRFIGNRSSGKMGLAVAREAVRLGAEVTVVAANVSSVEPAVEWVAVETVEELRAEVLGRAGVADVLVMAAAVSDFAPAAPAREKLRRASDAMTLELRPTADVLRAVREENPGLYVVGFAATYGDPVADAREKLKKKGADLVVGNDISREGIGFGAEENEVHLVSAAEERSVPQAAKTEVARVILESILTGMQGIQRGSQR